MATMEHVRYLAQTVGARGSTTRQEAEAGRYAARVLREAGLEPVIETFVSARSSYYPYALFAGLILAGEMLFWLGGRWGAAAALALTLFAIVSGVLELAFRPNPLRWLLPKGKSQNVFARICPQSEVREQVVLLGHLDSNRTPLLFSSDGWVRFLGIIVPLCLISAVLLMVLFAIGIMAPGLVWRLVSLPCALPILVLWLLMLQADLTPYSAGANDNATAAGVVLSVAERLMEDPLMHTAVWAVLSGCEEVGCYGADAFAQAHKEELGRPIWIPLENLGGVGADPTYLVSETFLLTSKSDGKTLELAEGIARRRPELGVHALRWRSTYTEGVIGAKHGFRVLTLSSFRRDGVLPEWHRRTDVVENVDAKVLSRCEGFLWELLCEIDKQVGEKA